MTGIFKTGSFEEMMRSEQTDFTNDGKCSGCGSCCTALLPMTDYELIQLKKYVKENNIEVCHHGGENCIDMICPFCDLAKEKDKCRIYEVRPRVCRTYICSKRVDKTFPKMYKLRNLWMEFGGYKNDR